MERFLYVFTSMYLHNVFNYKSRRLSFIFQQTGYQTDNMLWLSLECVHLYLILKRGQSEFTSTGTLLSLTLGFGT